MWVCRMHAATLLVMGVSLFAEAGSFRLALSSHPPVMQTGARMNMNNVQVGGGSVVSSHHQAAVGKKILSRRIFGQTCWTLGASLAFHAPEDASAEFPRFSSLTQADVESWEDLNEDKGLRMQEVSAGLGTRAVSEGDKLRVRYSVYLQDGTVVSRGQGVEQEFTLGKRQVPAGLEDGVRNMKAGGERMLFVPPEMGWTGKYRAAALQQIKSCGGTKCPLDEQPVIVFVKLEGYQKSECLGVGDLPISADVDSEKATISITIGSDACPEGNVEVTEKRLKARSMLDKLKDEGRLKAEEKQPFIIP